MSKTYLKHAFCALLLQVLTSETALADTGVRLDLQASSQRMAGKVADGMLLARGKMTAPGTHTGFQVWSDVSVDGGHPQRYVLTGKNNASNRLNVRLEGLGWQPDMQSGKGIRVYSREPAATFSIVADGDQTVLPDIWSLQVKGGLLK